MARIATDHHDELKSGRNRLVIFIGIASILAGLAMMISGGGMLSEYIQYVTIGDDFGIPVNPEIVEALPFILGLMFSGFLMIIGGGYGIGKSLRD